MDTLAVLGQLNDIPSTFKRVGPPYEQLIDSIAASLTLYTESNDATIQQVAGFTDAVNNWLDVWGLLFGIARGSDEADQVYQARIQNTLLAWVGTVPAIQAWLDMYATGGTVIENTGESGYVLNFPSSITLAQISTFLQFFNRIRPVGVPFSVQQSGIGLFLGTDEFLGDGRVAGNYLSVLSQGVPSTLSATTSNTVSLLPSLFLNDPSINS